MLALTISIFAFVVSVAALAWVLTEDWRCGGCGRYRRRGEDGKRRCESCGRTWWTDTGKTTEWGD